MKARTILLVFVLSVCSIVGQAPTWTQRFPVHSPSLGGDHLIVYDAMRQEAVLYNGFETWIWDGQDWTQKITASNPPPRRGFAFAFDSVRGEALLFGGIASPPGSGNLDDTWIWNGVDWVEKTPAISPPARNSSAMAFDQLRGEMVLFGGGGNTAHLNDTWVWNGSTWSQKLPPTSPFPLNGHVMAFDQARGEVVLHGGGGSGFITRSTWVWNGLTWNLKASGPQGVFQAIAYDEPREQILFFGGGVFGGIIFIPVGETHAWNGDTWTHLQPTSNPDPSTRHTMAFDRSRQEMILFIPRNSGETWIWPSTRDDLPTIDLTIDPQVKIAQVTFDPDINQDGRVDLVLGKSCVVQSRLIVDGAETPEVLEVDVQLQLDGEVIDTETIELSQSPDGTEVQTFFTPRSEGEFELRIIVDPSNKIIETEEVNNEASIQITVKETNGLFVAYRRITDCNPFFVHCYNEPSEGQVRETADMANAFLKATFPVSDDGFKGEILGDFSGSSIPFLGTLGDLTRLYLGAYVKTLGRVDRVIGVASPEYFNFHHIDETVAGFIVCPLGSAIVQEGFWTTVAHELGHSYDLFCKGPEEYELVDPGNPAKGFWVERRQKINDRHCFMGSNTFRDLTSEWIEDADYEHLFRKFQSEPVDPEVLLATGVVHSDGLVQVLDWITLPEGIIAQRSSGSYSLQLKDSHGEEVSRVSFEISFSMYVEPFGEILLDTAPFIVVSPYPTNAISAAILAGDGSQRLELDLSGKLLHDAVSTLPDQCIDRRNKSAVRNSLHSKVEAMSAMIRRGDMTPALNKLEVDILDKVEKWITEDCQAQDPLDTTKEKFLSLINALSTRLRDSD